MMIPFQQVPFEEKYEICEQIGSGQFAVVHRCVDRRNKDEVAAKFIRKSRTICSRRGAHIADIRKEVEILAELKHTNIISLYEVYEKPNEVILVLELVRGGELFEFIADKEKLNEDEASFLVSQILEGLLHLHGKNIAHLDLKPENVMLLDKNDRRIKLIDFGLSRKIIPGVDVREMMGTPEFVAPEIVNYEPLRLATDMWSVGVITYILLSGLSPFLGIDQQETFENISGAEYEFDEEYFAGTSEFAKDFICKLLVKDPMKRATVEDCLNHPWIRVRNETDAIIRKGKKCKLQNVKAINNRQRWKNAVKAITLCRKLCKASTQVPPPPPPVARRNHCNSNNPSDSDGNLVLQAIFSAVEDGNINGLQELLDAAKNVDINMGSRHGETAVHIAAGLGHLETLQFLQSKRADIEKSDHRGDTPIYWAARQGHVNVVKYLKEEGVAVDHQNNAGEGSLHVAARYGHSAVVQYLCNSGADVNLQDQHGETALHIAVWHGFPSIVQTLCHSGAKLNLRDKEEETPLHCAAARGHLESVQYLIGSGALLDMTSKKGYTALHLAIKRHHVDVAVMLMRAGCNFSISDNHGEMVIHQVCREGLLVLAQQLAALGARLDIPNKAGMYPLHIAAKHGHTEIVRCLCLAGCQVHQKNRDGIPAEITALAQGYSDIGDLLNTLRNDQLREAYITQLTVPGAPLGRVKLKVFGHSGVGKTALGESLKCGYLSGLFRRSRSSSITATSVKSSKGGCESPVHVPPNVELSNSVSTSNTSKQMLSFEPCGSNYSKGIQVQQLTISGVGDMSFWEFSSQPPYFIFYDHFIGNTTCIHAVIVNLTDPREKQLSQVLFWLNFLQARLPIQEPLGHCGKSSRPAKVVLVATHADGAQCVRTTTGEYKSSVAEWLLEEVLQRFRHVFDIHEHIFVVNTHMPTSASMRAYKNYLAETKSSFSPSLPKSNGFLESMLAHLPVWCKSSQSFPVLSWPQFIDMVRAQVNPLASEEHLKQLVQQLQIMGEVLYLKADGHDVVVLDPKWLCGTILGQLLSHTNLETARVTGCYTVDDFQLLFPETDSADLLQVLEALHLCTQCDNDGDVEYEFPCFNFVERLPGLWEKTERYSDWLYGGVQVKAPEGVEHLMSTIFTRFQIQLRRSSQEHHDPDNDLYQWCFGSKFCSGNLEGLLTLEESGEVIEVKVRGPPNQASACFFFLEDLLSVLDQTVTEMCPGLLPERHVLSARQLQRHAASVQSHETKCLLEAQMEGRTTVPGGNNNGQESLVDLFCFGAADLGAALVMGRDLHVSSLGAQARQRLCSLLDPPDPMGNDWCMLAVKLGLTARVPEMDALGSTARLLDAFSKVPDSTVGALVRKLRALGRTDAVETVLRGAPLFRVVHFSDDTDRNTDELGGSGSHGSANSNSNLSR